ncbi:MAG TPA: A24 family peptidase, partial [Gemmatimonadales bacterium]|nr:A24 family peptidase [Gemmatimonadales bacterium]
GCGLPISIQYPLIELAVAVIWGGMVWWFGPGLAAVAGAVFFTILLGIAVTDARAYIIPDEFSLGGLVIGLVLAALAGWNSFLVAALGAAVGFGLLWLVAVGGTWLFKQEAMGGGDIKMMAMVGAFVGWKGVLLTVFLGALLGSLIFVPLTLAGSKRLVPFGIFLALGAAAAYLVGPEILAWYGRFLTGA